MFSCHVDSCTYTSARAYNLDRHLKKEHDLDDDEITSIKDRRKQEMEASQRAHSDTLPFPCTHCSSRYGTQHSLRQHLREKHPETIAAPKFNVRCPMENCSVSGLRTREQLADHCRIDHSEAGDFEVIDRSFASIKEMEEWKHQIETLSNAAFTMDSNHLTYHYYWCSRGNKSRVKESSDINRTSKRTQSHCSAFINASLSVDGSVSIRACLDHVFHECDPASIPLNSTQKLDLDHILSQGYTVATTKEKLREYGEQHPFYWISSERSVRKLISRRKDKPWEREINDHQSLERRLDDEKDTTGIRILQTTPNEFMLVVMTPIQVDWLKKYGHRGVSVDDTFNTSKWPYKLTTVMVLDEMDRGLPAAFLLSSHTTQTEVSQLFQCVKNLLPSYDTEWFMSDDAPAFWNGFKRVFPKSKAIQLHCQWHVIKNLMQHANEVYGAKEERSKIVATSARNVARAIQKGEFWSLATSLLSDLDTDLPADAAYKKYFEKYLKSYSLWAPFMRVHAPFNTTMVSESFHSKLKMSVLGDNTLSRVDRLAHVLLTLPTEITEELSIADRKKYVSGVFRLQTQMSSHKKGIAYGEKTPTIVRKDKSHWIVESEQKDGKTYTVTDYGEDYCTCDSKNLHCMRCGVCPRRYRCNCPEGNRSGTNCKHCHWAIVSSNQEDEDSRTLPEARIELGDAIDLEHDYGSFPPLEPIDDSIPPQFLDDQVDEEELERRKREKEEEDRKRDQKNKYRSLCLEAINKAAATVGRCMREDDDETRLKALLEGITNTLESININTQDAAVRGERVKKRQGVRGGNLLDRETRGDVKRRRRAEMARPMGFPRRSPAENTVCPKCKRSEPRDVLDDDEDIDWVACSNTNCGLYYHEVCSPIGSMCFCRDGVMIYQDTDE